MKTQKFQSDDERSILTGMIVNHQVLGRIYSQLKTEKKPFRSKWSNLIALWCVEFFGRYERAPQKAIQALFESHAAATQDDDAIALVDKFLGSLSEDHKATSKEINIDHLIDTASRYFSEVRFDRLARVLEADVIRKDMEAARKHYADFTPINFSASAAVAVLTDRERMAKAFDSDEVDILIRYPGALGEFFGQHLQRDGFISFVAPDKRGKSFWLLDMVWRAAVTAKKRSVFFSVGDMSENQILRRLGSRACRRPREAGEVSWPKTIKRKSDGKFEVTRESKVVEGPLTGKVANLAMEKAWKKTAFTDSTLQMVSTPNSTTSMADIAMQLDEFIRAGWVPDVVVIDYMDILAMEPGSGKLDRRDQINENWKAARRLSQKYHVLVVTATQSNSASYASNNITKKNFSEDKRKNAHVTGMVGISQTDEEKEKGVFRLNWVVLREGNYLESRQVAVAGNLAMANPAMVSTW